MDELTIKRVQNENDWQKAVSIREEVFIVEQECPPHEEWDEFDAMSKHYLALSGGEPVGTARMRSVKVDGLPAAKLERFAIVKDWRGRGLGKRLVLEIVKLAIDDGFDRLHVHAQAHLEGLYHDLGFESHGEIFEEAGIPHIAMTLIVDPGRPDENNSSRLS